jgi:hypothetical protein
VEGGGENWVGQVVSVELFRCIGYVFCGAWVLCMWYVCMLLVGRVLRFPVIFCTAGFMLIWDLVTCLSSIAYFVIICWSEILWVSWIEIADCSCVFNIRLFCCSVWESYTASSFWTDLAFPGYIHSSEIHNRMQNIHIKISKVLYDLHRMEITLGWFH